MDLIQTVKSEMLAREYCRWLVVTRSVGVGTRSQPDGFPKEKVIAELSVPVYGMSLYCRCIVIVVEFVQP
jgi:hypothetical protein